MGKFKALTWVRSLFFKKQSNGNSNAKGQAVPTPQSARSTFRLARVFLVRAGRAGSSKPIQLWASEIGPSSLVFRTHSAVVDGEIFGIELLLPANGERVETVRGQAKVDWTVPVAKGFTGELALWFGREARLTYIDFLSQQQPCAPSTVEDERFSASGS